MELTAPGKAKDKPKSAKAYIIIVEPLRLLPTF